MQRNNNKQGRQKQYEQVDVDGTRLKLRRVGNSVPLEGIVLVPFIISAFSCSVFPNRSGYILRARRWAKLQSDIKISAIITAINAHADGQEGTIAAVMRLVEWRSGCAGGYFFAFGGASLVWSKLCTFDGDAKVSLLSGGSSTMFRFWMGGWFRKSGCM